MGGSETTHTGSQFLFLPQGVDGGLPGLHGGNPGLMVVVCQGVMVVSQGFAVLYHSLIVVQQGR